tara:strand:- start:71 stop:277 length:207 start_codon:yes stop_codon:yes gene_type:complete
MKLLLILSIFSSVILPTKTQASSADRVNSVCDSFENGKIDAFKTLEALDININHYSIGVNNTAKIFCS